MKISSSMVIFAGVVSANNGLFRAPKGNHEYSNSNPNLYNKDMTIMVTKSMVNIPNVDSKHWTNSSVDGSSQMLVMMKAV